MSAGLNEIAQAFSNVNVDVDTYQLECLEGDNLNIRCTNSSDFIVGRQTNFHGPVTIINCDSPERHFESEESTTEERVVIKDKVITASATNTVQNQALAEQEKNNYSQSKKVSAVKFLTKDFIKIPMWAWIVVFVLSFGAAVPSGVYLGIKTENFTVRPVEMPPKIISSMGVFNVFKKEQWGGLKGYTPSMDLPVYYVVISHTATNSCYFIDTCKEDIRNYQKLHISQNFGDIAYNFLVGGDGNIYEGRGWQHASLVSRFAENKNVDINFIGDFSEDENPTPPQVEAVKALIEYGLNNSLIAQDYSLIAANSTAYTQSPGQNLYKIIMTWPHFDPNPEDTESKSHVNRSFGLMLTFCACVFAHFNLKLH